MQFAQYFPPTLTRVMGFGKNLQRKGALLTTSYKEACATGNANLDRLVQLAEVPASTLLLPQPTPFMSLSPV